MGIHAAPEKQPSSLKRTLNCPAWPRYYTDTQSSESAALGSVAHYVGERCLCENRNASAYLGKVGFYDRKKGEAGISDRPGQIGIMTDRFYRFRIDGDMCDYIQVYLDTVHEKIASCVNPIVKFEEKLDLSFVIEGMSGTADALIIEPFGKAIVIDLKYGYYGVDVGPLGEGTPQLPAYALGAIGKDNLHMIETVEVIIVQPRAPHPDGPVRGWVFEDINELQVWGQETVRPAILRTADLDAPHISGEWCKFCPAENALNNNGQFLCPAKRRETEEAALEMFGGLQKYVAPPDPATLDGETLGRYMTLIVDAVEPWFASIKEEAFNRLSVMDPNAPKGWSLKEGRLGNRKYGVTEVEVVVTLSRYLDKATATELFYSEVPVSPAQLEKKLKKMLSPEDVNDIMGSILAERKPGRPVLAKASDNVNPVNTIDEMFG
jgi:hypothetical protein